VNVSGGLELGFVFVPARCCGGIVRLRLISFGDIRPWLASLNVLNAGEEVVMNDKQHILQQEQNYTAEAVQGVSMATFGVLHADLATTFHKGYQETGVDTKTSNKNDGSWMYVES